MIADDVVTKVLDTKSFPQHNIAGLISAITFIVLFSQDKPLRWKEINTHTHTHTQTNKLQQLKRKSNILYLIGNRTYINFKVFSFFKGVIKNMIK